MRTRRYLVLAVIAMLFSGALDLASTLLCLSAPSRGGLTAVELNPNMRAMLLSGDVAGYLYVKCLLPVALFSILAWCHYRSCKYNIAWLRRFIEVFTLIYALGFVLVFINNIIIYAILSW